MRRYSRLIVSILLGAGVLAVVAYWFVLPVLAPPVRTIDFSGIEGDPKRGAYILAAAGCIACHTDQKSGGGFLAGGPALNTPFGTFYAPNITPHPKSGIGGWSRDEFARAMTSGISPKGAHYFPSFPYTSYTGMRAQDIADLKRYLDTVAPIGQDNRPHDISWPFSDRRFLNGWKWLFFKPGVFMPDRKTTAQVQRGAYLVNVLGHCGECHTQRNVFGGRSGNLLAGNTRGPDGEPVPGISGLTTRKTDAWTKDELITALQLGMTRSGDFLGASMAEVIQNSTSKLTAQDVAAMVEFLDTLPASK